jgi:hypothetical protein
VWFCCNQSVCLPYFLQALQPVKNGAVHSTTFGHSNTKAKDKSRYQNRSDTVFAIEILLKGTVVEVNGTGRFGILFRVENKWP